VQKTKKSAEKNEEKCYVISNLSRRSVKTVSALTFSSMLAQPLLHKFFLEAWCISDGNDNCYQQKLC